VQGTHSVSIIKTNQIMMHRDIITVCSEFHIKIQMNDVDTVKFSDDFAKLRKAPMSFFMSVRPYVPSVIPLKNSAPPGRIFVIFLDGWGGGYKHLSRKFKLDPNQTKIKRPQRTSMLRYRNTSHLV
jgi:hypothetical protein